MRVRIQQNNPLPSHLVANRALFDKIEAYFVVPDQPHSQATPDQISGYSVSPNLRPTLDRLLILTLDFQGEREVYLRTHTSNAYILGFNLEDQKSQQYRESKHMMFHGGYFSILVFSSFLFFIVALALRHKAMFALGIVTLFSGMSEATMSGLFAADLWDANLTYAKSLSFSLGIALIATYYFLVQLWSSTRHPFGQNGA